MKLNTVIKFAGLVGFFMVSGIAMVFAQENAEAASSTPASILQWLGLGGAIGLGIAAAGVGMGQGKAVGAAMEGISRNPQAQGQMFGPLILGLAFMEALVIFTLIFVVIFKQTLL